MMMPTSSPDWAERYAAAQSMLLAADAITNGAVYPHWIDDDHFWYRRRGSDQVEYRVVEAATGEGHTGLTQAAVAEALASYLGAEVDGERLILRDLDIGPERGRASFTAFGETYAYDRSDGKLEPAARRGDPSSVISPDGGSAAFLRDHNVWVRDLGTGTERALTTDGTAHHGYAATPDPLRRVVPEWQPPPPPEGRWSPDSKRFFTLQTDERHVPDLPMMVFAPVDGVRPEVTASKTSLPGDARVTEFRMLAIEAATGRPAEARYPRLAAVRMNDTPFSAGLAWWDSAGRTAYFVDIERGERAAHVVAFDVATGQTQVVFSETADTYVELGVNVYGPALIHPLPATNELVWYSERSGHGHLYLYDLATGALKNAITSGPGQVREVLHVDPARREVLFTAAGMAADRDPYLAQPCAASLDGGPARVLSAEAGDHIVWRPGSPALSLLDLTGEDPRTISGVSPGATYFVETVGAVDRLPRTVLRRRTGEEVAVIEVAQDRGLPAHWAWPEPVRLKAADGITDTYGLLFTPWDHQPSAAYPVIDLIYGGPQLSHVPKSAFAHGGAGSDLQYLEAAHLSALGAYVLILDGRGTANRERAFREASYGAMHTASNIEDHLAGLRELARRYPAMDLERAGICGFSGGGYMTALAALRFGDFFKVAVAGGGNYDQSLFWHTWGERYHGAFEPAHYAAQAAKTYASGLTGKLLLIHGLQDGGCHPAALFQLVQALIEENKDADLVVLPREGHQLSGYGLRRRLDYFVTHLFGSTPPAGISMTSHHEELLATARAAEAPPGPQRAG